MPAHVVCFGLLMERSIITVSYTHLDVYKRQEDVFAWWMEDKNTEGQISLSDLELWRAENEKWE